MSLTRAKDKDQIIDETVISVKRSIGKIVPTSLVYKIVESRNKSIRKAIEDKTPRILIEGIGSFRIKQGKNGFEHKRGREYYVKQAGRYNLKNIGINFATSFKIMSNGE